MRPLITESDVEFTPIRAQGPGGQHVNKASTAVQLRFDVRASRLPAAVQERLLALPDNRISSDGVVVIKAQVHRSLDGNKADALARLQALVDQASHVARPRRPTRPTYGSQQRRLAGKSQRAQVKAGRGKVVE
jgi:ribosome-associated protein